MATYLDFEHKIEEIQEEIVSAHAIANMNEVESLQEDLEKENINFDEVFNEVDGILVAGGFGNRGINGKMEAIKYARENNKPFLGICLGMQLAMIEFARNVLKLEDANSVEFDSETKNPIIYLIDHFLDQNGKQQIRTHSTPLGGTMRLGSYKCSVKTGSKLAEAYNGQKIISERHRHRFEANPKYRKSFEKHGMEISGESDGLIEAIEIKNHPWFVGVQFHPESIMTDEGKKILENFIMRVKND